MLLVDILSLCDFKCENNTVLSLFICELWKFKVCMFFLGHTVYLHNVREVGSFLEDAFSCVLLHGSCGQLTVRRDMPSELCDCTQTSSTRHIRKEMEQVRMGCFLLFKERVTTCPSQLEQNQFVVLTLSLYPLLTRFAKHPGSGNSSPWSHPVVMSAKDDL
jgi:hypothetical protein